VRVGSPVSVISYDTMASSHQGTHWAVWAIAATLLFGAWGVLGRSVLLDIDWKLLTIAAFPANVLFTAILWSVKPPNFRRLTPRAFLGAIGLGIMSQSAAFAFFLALSQGRASLVVPLTALYPTVTLVGAFLILREPVGLRQLIGIAVAIAAGVMLALD
jgi:transporter family protein